MMPPKVQTKGCVAYALAVHDKLQFNPSPILILTLMCRVLDHFLHHGLHDGNIAVQGTANKSRKQSDPVRLGETKGKAAQRNARQANQRHGLPTVNIGNGAPTEGGDGFSDSVGRQQESGVKRSIPLGDSQVLYHDVRVRQDGVERKGLGESAYSWSRPISFEQRRWWSGWEIRTDDDKLLPREGLVLWIHRHCRLNTTMERASRQETAARVFEEGDSDLH